MTALVDEFLAGYVGDAKTKKCLGWNLNRVRRPIAEGGLGEIPVDRLTAATVRKWRATLPVGSAWHVHKSLRQVLNFAVGELKVADENVAADVKNPRPTRRPVVTFIPDEVYAIAAELDPRWAAIPHFAAATGLRPEEWIALTWDDVDLKAAVPYVRVERAYSDGELKSTKTKEARRVPLQDAAVEALERHSRRLDTRLVFYALRPDRKPKAEPWIDLTSFRKAWKLACECAGVPYRTPYALRHTFASEALAAGIPTFSLARRMGTSLQMIEETYGHLVRDADEWEVARLNERGRKARASVETAVAR